MIDSTMDRVMKTGSKFLGSRLSCTDLTHDHPQMCPEMAMLFSTEREWGMDFIQGLLRFSMMLRSDTQMLWQELLLQSSWCLLFHMKGMSQCELLGLLFSRIIWYDKILMQPKRLLYPMKCRRHGCDWCRISPLAQVYTLVSGCQSQDKQPLFCMSKFSFLCPISCRQLPQYPHTFVFLNSKWKWKRFSTLKKSYLGRIGEHIWIIWRKCGINR